MALEIVVVNATNLPNLESFGKIDPYVSVQVQGISNKTKVIKGELNPQWNESLLLDLKGQPLKEQDELKIFVKDWERVGRNRLIGLANIPMKDVLQYYRPNQQIKRKINLTDSNQRPIGAVLNLLIRYKPPDSDLNAQTSEGREVGGTQQDVGQDQTDGQTEQGGEDEPDSSTKRTGTSGISRNSKSALSKAEKNKDRDLILSTRKQDFQLRVKIVEGRQLPGSNINPICRVTCYGQSKQTKSQKSTSAPSWNEIFFLNYNSSPAELFDQLLLLEVFDSKIARRDSFIGSFKCDLGTIYGEPDHSFVNKWLLLCNPDNVLDSHKGYLKICVSLLGPGNEAPSFAPSKDDDKASNLLRPPGIILKPATFRLKLYCAEDLPRMDSNFLQSVKRVFGSDDAKELVDPFFTFNFAGREVKSKIIYNCHNPKWNQELRLGLWFPSFCERLRLQLFDWDRLTAHDLIGTNFLLSSQISQTGCDSISSDGFLPMFGPCFVNFYGSPREFFEFPSDYEELNHGKGEGVAYRGRVLIELQTVHGQLPSCPVQDLSNDDVLRVERFMHRQKYKLYSTFLNASMISVVDAPVEFEVSIGNYGNRLDDLLAPCVSTTPPTRAVFDGCHYYYLPWGDSIPCIAIDSHWEDISFRLEALNLLVNISDTLETNIANVRVAIQGNLTQPELAQGLIKLLDQLIDDCGKPLPKVEAGVHVDNELDQNIRSYRISVMGDIVKRAGELKKQLRKEANVRESLKEIKNYLAMLKNLTVEPQNSLPDVVIWMISGEKRIAYYRCPAHLVLWSPNPDYRGKFSGKLTTFALKYPGSKAEQENLWEIPALIRVRIWLGLEKYEQDWHRMQKEGDLNVFAETYENQVNVFKKWQNTGPIMFRPKWSDVTGKIELNKDDFKPPPGWEWDGDWHINPELSMLFDKDAGHSEFLEEVYECESRLPGANWNVATIPWTDVKGDECPRKNEIQLPKNWEWQDDWQVDLNRAVDENGWEYTVDSSMGGYGPVRKMYHMCRRRRWVRMRSVLKTAPMQFEQIKQQHNLIGDGWEYAPLHSMKFHSTERKLDLVRRRRWHRKMVPEGTKQKIEAATPFLIQFAAKWDKDATEKASDESFTRGVTSAPRIFMQARKSRRYQLRAYIYQGRDLLAGDSNGLSDPFARVMFLNQSQTTEKKMKTLSPTWDQSLIFEMVDIYGEPNAVLENPPEIIVEVFDHDTFGSPEFLGRTMATPLVKLEPSDSKKVLLKWFEVKKGNQYAGELLMAFELLLMDSKEPPVPRPKKEKVFKVPEGIRPEMVRTAVWVMCWGLRNMKTFQLSEVSSPSVEIVIGSEVRQSKTIQNMARKPNFEEPLIFFDILLPKEELYLPPINIKVRDSRSFGRKPTVGVCSVKLLDRYILRPISHRDEDDLDGVPTGGNIFDRENVKPQDHIIDMKTNVDLEEDIDWWSKYYASTGKHDECKKYLKLGYDKIQIFERELEKSKDFKNFSDFCNTFPLLRGKSNEDEESEVVGEFKGTFCIYPLLGVVGDLKKPEPPSVLSNLPSTEPVECIVRVYVIRANDLQPSDPNGLSDPYIQIKVGKQSIDNVDEYVPNSLNPIFGKMFELKAMLPKEKDLHVCIKDKDRFNSDDFIGETIVDLENRYLTRYRATVGLPQSYCTSGVCRWRDSQKPSEILNDLCRKYLKDLPVYTKDDISIGEKVYSMSQIKQKTKLRPHWGPAKERLALHVLHRLPYTLFGGSLVPEHVEKRSLYNSLQPDIPQGQVEMWVDLFPVALGTPGPPINIKPRKPKNYELRVVIKNTFDVVLQERSAVTGEKMSDIYVKGWMSGIDEKQKTDVHYRSLDGEGNFNWRFVFPFQYIPAEQCLVINEKEHFWNLDRREEKHPPVLILQVWDDDQFSADDFLGFLELNLHSLPMPENTADKCSLDQLPSKSKKGGSGVTLVSLFDKKRIKGFWPFSGEVDGKKQLTGKLEMQMELVSGEEIEKMPVGRGRSDPNQNPFLEVPQRPETSFLWFRSPWRTFKLIVWRRFKLNLIMIVMATLLVLFLVLFFYSIPGIAVKKIFGVS